MTERLVPVADVQVEDVKAQIREKHTKTTMTLLGFKEGEELKMREFIESNKNFLGKRLYTLLCHYVGYNKTDFAYSFGPIADMMGVTYEQAAKNYNEAIRRLKVKLSAPELEGISKEDLSFFNGLKPRVKNGLMSSGVQSMQQLVELMKEHHCTLIGELNEIMVFRGIGDTMCDYIDSVMDEYFGTIPQAVYTKEDNDKYFNRRIEKAASILEIPIEITLTAIDYLSFNIRLNGSEVYVLELYLGLNERGLKYAFPRIASYRNIALHHAVDVYNKSLLIIKKSIDDIKKTVPNTYTSIFDLMIHGIISHELYSWLFEAYDNTSIHQLYAVLGVSKPLYDTIVASAKIDDTIAIELKDFIETMTK